MSTSKTLATALQHHQSGRLSEAEVLYRQILAQEPRHAGALHMLGVLSSQLQRHDIAVDLIRQAIAAKPDFAEAHVNLGVALRHQNRLDEAIASFRRASLIRPDYVEAHHHLGCAQRDKGEWVEAIGSFRRVVALKPTFAQSVVGLAGALQGSGQVDEAIVSYQRAIVLWPSNADLPYNLGNAFYGRRQLDQAIAAYRQALLLKPDYVEARNNLANALREQGRLDEAIAECRAVLAIRPDLAEAHNALGNALRDADRFDEAIVSYKRVLELRPDIAEAHSNIGNILEERGQLTEAADCYRQAILLKPDLGEAHNNLGNALRKQEKFDDAMASYRRAVELRPGLPEAHLNLGNSHRQKLELEEAMNCYRRAIQLRPEYAEVYHALGMTLHLCRREDDAISSFQMSLKIRPDCAETQAHLGISLMSDGQVENAIMQDRLALANNPNMNGTHDNLVYALQLLPDSTAIEIRDELHRYDQQHALPLRDRIQPHANDRLAGRRLRVGYVSGDFRNHAVGWNILPLLREHDREKFETFCYSNTDKMDAYTDRFRQIAGVFRDIFNMNDDAAAQLIRDDGIDILVDLSLHTEGHRLTVFARKPAPVQVTFAGYPGSTGLETIDYRLTDPYLDPPGVGDEFYSERSIRLPDSFWCYDPQAMDVADFPPVNPLPALTSGHVTFGCLNNHWKINDRVLGLWAAAMAATPGSRFLMRANEGRLRQRMIDQLGRLNIDSGRIDFVGFQPHLDYLRSYERIDLGLDCFPYNGHTTSLDSFWMGVPVITLIGHTVVGRAGLSQLCNLDLRELAAETPEGFLKIVDSLVNDLPRLAQLRCGMRERMFKSPLTDGVRFARNIESAYQKMWQTWCEKIGE